MRLYLNDDKDIFTLIKKKKFAEVLEIINDGKIDINIVDGVGNDIATRLLKMKEYDLVISLIKRRSWDANKQNDDGDTFGHILAQDNSMGAIKVMDELKKNKRYLPNIKNKKGQTALDKAINNNYLVYAFKILEDERFDSIEMKSFKNLFSMCINKNYGKYSIINNLEVVIGSLENKRLNASLNMIVFELKRNFNLIKKEILNNKVNTLREIVGI